jgi:hypothetical protein
MSISIGAPNQINAIDVRGLDLESALMAVQSNRANVLETQLKDQIAAVQAKNEKISRLNQLLGAMNKAAASFPSDAKAGDKVDFSSYAEEINSAAESAGITLPPDLKIQKGSWEVKYLDGTRATVDAAGKARAEKQKVGNFGIGFASNGKSVVSIKELQAEINPTKGKVDGFIQQLKSQIDSLSNSQQMDMLRLQSLSNKRNEAFEIMTNFVKKMQDNRSSIVGNMR